MAKNAMKIWRKEGMSSTLLLDSKSDVARLYGAAALDAAMAGRPVPDPVTESYGCGVKY